MPDLLFKPDRLDYRQFYNNVFDLIDGLTPLSADCGTICNSACCKGTDKDGMLLFPHEEEMLMPSNFSIKQTDNGNLLICDGNCERKYRPLSCRIFPFFPLLDEDGVIRVILDPRAYTVCPLVYKSSLIKFDREFIRTIRKAGRMLTRDDDCRQFLKSLSEELILLMRLLKIENGGYAARFR